MLATGPLEMQKVNRLDDQGGPGIVEQFVQLAELGSEPINLIAERVMLAVANRFDAVLPFDDQGSDRRCGAHRIGCQNVQRHHELVLVERMAGVAGNG